jgi:flagellar biosynthesis component FlhA
MDRLTRLSRQMLAAGQAPVVLCAPQIRLAFRRFFEHTFADLGVLSYAEIPPRVAVQSVATVPCPE